MASNWIAPVNNSVDLSGVIKSPPNSIDAYFLNPSKNSFDMSLSNVLKTIGNIGSAFTPFAGIASAIGSFFGQDNQNELQLQAQRETNAQNYKIWQEQQQHNIDMFNLQNDANIANWEMQHRASVNDWKMQQEYNTAFAQRQRLEDAGLNPYLMMNGGSAGVAQSQPNMPNMNGAQATPAGAPQMQAPHPSAFIDPITTALNQMQQSLVSSSQALKNVVDTGATAEKTPVEVNNINADTGKKEAEAGKAEAEAKESVSRTELNNINKYWKPKLFEQDKIFKDRTNQSLFWSNSILRNQALISDLTFNEEINLKRATTMNMLLDVDTKRQLLSYMPAEQAATLYLMSCQAASEVKKGHMYEANAKAFIAQAFSSISQGYMYKQQGNYYGALSTGQNYDNQVRFYGLEDEKKATQYYWKSQYENNWFDYDSQKGFNTHYKMMNDIYGVGMYKGANYFATKLYNAANLSLDLDVTRFGADIYDLNEMKGYHFVGQAFRELFGGWFPFSAGYNINYQRPQPQKQMRPIGFAR